jgi:hypothetical protein
MSAAYRLLAQGNQINFEVQDSGGASTLIFAITELAIIVLVIVSMWKVYVKAGEPGWAAIIPIYNIIVLLRIAGKPWWWVFLFLIPLVNLIIGILVSIDVAKNFGQTALFGIGLTFLGFIFYPILAFGDARFNRVV